MENITFLDPKFFEPYSQIAIFVQKSNDMDTCACACALAELINYHYKGEKNVSILGLYGKSKFLTELENYSNKPLKWEEDVLVVLSEISQTNQIHKHHAKLIKEAKAMVILDHHDKDHESLKELIENKNIKIIHDPEQTSACEVLWGAIKETFADIPQRIMEILFMGLYSDTKGLTSERLSVKTFSNITDLMNRGNLQISSIVNKLNHKPVANMLLFADTMKDAVKEKNLLFISLNPKNVYNRIPKLLIKGRDGSIRQKSLLTYIPRWVEQYASVNTIVFVHYSLHEPYSSTKKFVYVVLVKENPALEHLLKELKFRQNRNRWSREMDFFKLKEIINRYKELFTA